MTHNSSKKTFLRPLKQQIICLALLFFSLTATAASNSNLIILDEMGVRNLQIETVVAGYVDFEETTFAIGRVEEIPASRVVVSTRIAGRIVELDVFTGDYVKKGQRIAKVESRQLGDPPPTVELFAPQSGRITDSHVRLGQPVEPSEELMDIVDDRTVWAIAQIPEQEASHIQPGTRARIHLPALGEQKIKASLVRFGVEADRHAGTVAGIFEISNLDGRLRPGMRAEFSIVLETRDDVLAIPRESVQGDPASRKVFIKDFDLPNAFIQSSVVLGQQNDQLIEVTSGLFPGDEVVTRGSYGLSFTSNNSGISLKEALDAAHGHEHNKDGSEITNEQRAAHTDKKTAKTGQNSSENPNYSPLNKALIAYSVIITLLCVLLFQSRLNRQKALHTEPIEKNGNA